MIFLQVQAHGPIGRGRGLLTIWPRFASVDIGLKSLIKIFFQKKFSFVSLQYICKIFVFT